MAIWKQTVKQQNLENKNEKLKKNQDILQTTNWGDCTQEDLDMAKEEKPHGRNF